MLELRTVTYRYPGYARHALDRVDLALAEGEIVGLTGLNGAGKSTLGLVATGLAPGSIGGELTGDVLVDGSSIRGLRPFELAGRVGLVFSNPEAQRIRVAGTVFEEVAFGPVNLGLPLSEVVSRTRVALEALAIADLAERHPGRLSGGQSQLVAIASMLAMQSRHLVLDEPVAELDGEGRALVAAAIRRLASAGTSLLVAEHDEELLAATCGRIVRLDAGRVVADGPAGTSARGDAAREVVAPGGSASTDGPAPGARPAPAGAPVIRCEGVRFDYPDSTRALDGVDLEIRAGERLAIVGRNGSGKTTLVRTWNGLLRPTGGQLNVDGRPTAARRVAELARTVGMTFQDPDRQIFGRTCRDEVAFGPRLVGVRGETLAHEVTDALEAVGLGDAAGTNPFDLGPSRRRLLALASVLAMRTPVVVLDEPTMGLDSDEISRVRAVVEALPTEGRTVVAISHDRRFVAGSFDRAVVLDRGRVVADRPADEVFGRDVEALVPPRGRDQQEE